MSHSSLHTLKNEGGFHSDTIEEPFSEQFFKAQFFISLWEDLKFLLISLNLKFNETFH